MLQNTGISLFFTYIKKGKGMGWGGEGIQGIPPPFPRYKYMKYRQKNELHIKIKYKVPPPRTSILPSFIMPSMLSAPYPHPPPPPPPPRFLQPIYSKLRFYYMSRQCTT